MDFSLPLALGVLGDCIAQTSHRRPRRHQVLVARQCWQQPGILVELNDDRNLARLRGADICRLGYACLQRLGLPLRCRVLSIERRHGGRCFSVNAARSELSRKEKDHVRVIVSATSSSVGPPLRR